MPTANEKLPRGGTKSTRHGEERLEQQSECMGVCMFALVSFDLSTPARENKVKLQPSPMSVVSAGSRAFRAFALCKSGLNCTNPGGNGGKIFKIKCDRILSQASARHRTFAVLDLGQLP